MKKLLSIAITCVFSFLLLGQFFVFELELEQNREAMISLVKSKQVNINGSLIFTISKVEGEKVIDGNEISWQGHRYDIISLKENPSGYQVIAINDGVEESLLASFDQNFSAEGLNKGSIPVKNSKLSDDLLKDYALPPFFSAKALSIQSLESVRSEFSMDKIQKGHPSTMPIPPRYPFC